MITVLALGPKRITESKPIAALGRRGVHLLSARNVTEARNLLRTRSDGLDALLLALSPPGKSSLAFLRDFRSVHPPLTTVALVPPAAVELAAEAARCGADAVIPLPPKTASLFRLLRRGSGRLVPVPLPEGRLLDLMDLTRSILSSMELDRILRRALRHVVDWSGADEASLILRPPGSRRLELAAALGMERSVRAAAKTRGSNRIARWVITHREPLLLEGNLAGTPFEKEAKARSIVTGLCLPLVADGRGLGALSINHRVPGMTFSPSLMRLLRVIADVVAIAIRNATLYRGLREANRSLRAANRELLGYQDRLRQSERLSSLGMVAASIAHELRSPLSTIMTYAELLAQKSFPGDIERRGISAINHEAERMSRIFHQLLGFSRQAGPERVILDLNRVVEDTLVLIEHHLTRFASVRVETHLVDPLPAVEGDHGQLQQVFLNLASNAAQAMPDGGTLTITTSGEHRSRLPAPFWDEYDQPPPRRYATAAITDTGRGIPLSVRRRLFKSLFTTKAAGKGTGLGLSICRSIVQEHRGFIEVRSTPGKGTTFVVGLPAAEDAEPPQTAPAKSE